jgi:hypothetical protein
MTEGQPGGGRAAHRFDNTLRYRNEDHPHQTALTPPYVLDVVRSDLGGTIDLDPCATPANPVGAQRFYCPPEDGAELPWDADTIYVNPPYGRAKERWAARCVHAANQGSRVILLIPAHPDTRAFQAAATTASAIVFVRGRLKFGAFGEIRPNGRQVAASHGSALIGWNVALTHTATLGMLVRPGQPEGIAS